jgi:excisionase family DNA binding protein
MTDRPPLQLLTVDQAAELLGMPARWVYRQFAAGRLPGRRFGRSILFSRPELERWLAGEAVQNGEQRRRGPGAVAES